MNRKHIQGLWLRHMYPLKRDIDTLTEMFYWPLIDTLLWGITGQWITQSGGAAFAIGAILSALILWNMLWRSQSEVGRNLIDEIWNNNLMNMFASPLKLTEWIVGVIILSFVKMFLTIAVMIPVIYLLYQVNVFHVGWWLVFFFISVTMTGWWIGFIASAIVIVYGPKMQSFVWTLPGILLPFSAVYFPLSRLPLWIQPISRILPTTYIFEALRSIFITGTVDVKSMVLSFVLNSVYLLITVVLFVRCFEKSRELGLGRFG